MSDWQNWKQEGISVVCQPATYHSPRFIENKFEHVAGGGGSRTCTGGFPFPEHTDKTENITFPQLR